MTNITKQDLNTRFNEIILDIVGISGVEDHNRKTEMVKKIYNDLCVLKLELTGFDGFKEYVESTFNGLETEK